MKLLNLLLLLCISISIQAQDESSTQHFRHLRYNHVSPFIQLVGIHPIDKATAQSTSHYIFKYDKSKRLVEIINNHYHTEKKHPLASIGVFKMVIKYEKGEEIRTFFDLNNNRITNDRGVYKEVFSLGKNQFKNKLEFFDIEGNPMESNWNISKYQWEKKNKWVIERRFNLKNEAVKLSPYFDFDVTGILLDKNGVPKAKYNLNEQLEVVANPLGIASYQDKYDDQGNHVEYSYHNVKDELTLNKSKFAVGEKIYDKMGNHIGIKLYDAERKMTFDRPTPSNVSIELSGAASQKDSIEIRETSLGYLIGLQQLKPDLMDKVMNDSLNKVTIGYDRKLKKEVARPTTHQQMIDFATDWNKANNKFPPVPNNEVTILDIYNRIATVRLVSDNWVEYLHLIKLDGNWEIINLLWQHKDINRYPK
ncbi:MAG: nuclear transport factor 2 family protein [Saprospiraceae bacterium]